LDILSSTILVPQTVSGIKNELIKSGLSETEAADTKKLADRRRYKVATREEQQSEGIDDGF